MFLMSCVQCSYLCSQITDQLGAGGGAVLSNPDDAWSLISAALAAAQTSISIYIYQITDDEFTNLLLTANSNGVTIKLLVSDRIYSTTDWKAGNSQAFAL